MLTAEEAIAYINEATGSENRRSRKTTVFHAIYGVNMQQFLVVTRTIKITERVPFDQDHYPDMTLVQAIDYELQMPRGDKIEHFAEGLGAIPNYEVELTENVRVEK